MGTASQTFRQTHRCVEDVQAVAVDRQLPGKIVVVDVQGHQAAALVDVADVWRDGSCVTLTQQIIHTCFLV